MIKTKKLYNWPILIFQFKLNTNLSLKVYGDYVHFIRSATQSHWLKNLAMTLN